MREEPADPWQPDEDVLACMRAFGAPQTDIDAVRARIDAQRQAARDDSSTDSFPVWRDNWPVIEAFLAVQTQWVYAGMAGVRTGFGYAGVGEWIDRFVPRRKRKTIFAGLQVMEHAVLAADRELADKEMK